MKLKRYFAIHASNIEVASIANSIDPRKPSVAAHPTKLLLQWCREDVDATYNGTDELHSITTSYPIIHSISSSDVMQRYTRRYSVKLLDAKEPDIERTCLAAETAKHVGTAMP